MSGKVYLVGAGPGDPGLLTRRGHQLLTSCNCLVYDALVGEELPDMAPPDAEKIYVGKRAGQHSLTQPEINDLLVARARAGGQVCRLKGGDPFVFGRGGEEALACVEAGVAFEVVPGVTSAIAVAAYAGIPVTQRGISASFAVVTGHTALLDAPPEDLPTADTLIFLMGIGALGTIVSRLLARGEQPDLPVAVIRWGTTAEQVVVTGTLETIEAEVAARRLISPALIIVGEAVKLRERLAWFDTRPLWGQNIVVTRSRQQASGLVEALQLLGARTISCPTIRIEECPRDAALDAAIADLASYDWVVFTSTNGVDAFLKLLQQSGLDARALHNSQLAAIGPATAQALEAHGLVADLVPAASQSEHVAADLLERGVTGQKVLLVRAQAGREHLALRLSDAGAFVVTAAVYRTLPEEANREKVREMMGNGEIDWVTFTSSSTVKNFLSALGADFVQEHRTGFRVATIGPITSQTAEANGLLPDLLAPQATVEALVASLVAAVASPRA